MAYEDRVYYQSDQITSSNSTGDKATFTIHDRCTVKRIYCVVEGTEATQCVVNFDKRPTAGSDTGRGDADVGALTFGASNRQGKYIYEDPTSTITLDEGDQVVVEVATASTAAKNFVAGMICIRAPEVAANNTAMVSA